MMQKPILILIILTILPAVSAELTPTSISINAPDSADTGKWIWVTGQITRDDGSPLERTHMKICFVKMWYDDGSGWTLDYAYKHINFDAEGNMKAAFKTTTAGNTKFKFHMDDYPQYGWAGSESGVITINVVDPNKNNADVSGLVKFIGYAKGFFALVFFGVLGVTIGTGCYSAAVHDPQKKAGAQEGMFSLLKVLVTVTCFYMAVLFLASA